MQPQMMAFIADMYGPRFLLLFAGVAVAGLVFVRLAIRAFEPDRDAPEPKLPAKPDPFEIAFLRGGTPAVVQVALLRLVQKKLLALRRNSI